MQTRHITETDRKKLAGKLQTGFLRQKYNTTATYDKLRNSINLRTGCVVDPDPIDFALLDPDPSWERMRI